MQQRKLSLILDIDATLLHATESPGEEAPSQYLDLPSADALEYLALARCVFLYVISYVKIYIKMI